MNRFVLLRKIIFKTISFPYWICWEFLGLRAIYVKLAPPPKSVTDSPDYKPPCTFGILLFTLYFALLGFATARHERLLERAEFKYNTLTTLLGSGAIFDKELIKTVGLTKVPPDPGFEIKLKNLLSPWKNFVQPVLFSLFTKVNYYTLHNNHIKPKEDLENFDEDGSIKSQDGFLIMMVILWRSKLENALLWEAQLDGLLLNSANFKNAYLEMTNFEGTFLKMANMQGAILSRANLKDADLEMANLKNATLIETILIDANLKNVNMSNAFLAQVNLSEASLSEANISGSNIMWGNLRKAYLWSANLSNTNLSGARLSGANCNVPSDYLPKMSYPLFRARHMLHGVLSPE